MSITPIGSALQDIVLDCITLSVSNLLRDIRRLRLKLNT
jgi:hypothetical protein